MADKPIVLVARMTATSRAFKPLEAELYRRGSRVQTFIADGKPFQVSVDEITAVARSAQVLVTGMGTPSEFATEELAAIDAALSAEVPVAVFADTHGAPLRPHFSRVAPQVTCLVLHDLDAQRAGHAGFKAQVITGSLLWEEYFSAPKYSRADIRTRLEAGDQKVIFCPGGKDLVVNTLHWGGVIEAVAGRSDVLVVLSPHPSEIQLLAKGKDGDEPKPFDPYESLVKYSPVPVRVVRDLKGAELLPGTDLVVESASGVGDQAACLRIPCISFFTAVALERMKKEQGQISWDPCALGVSQEVRGSSLGLMQQIVGLLFDDQGAATKMRTRQEEVYPAPKASGTAIKKMADAILALADSGP